MLKRRRPLAADNQLVDPVLDSSKKKPLGVNEAPRIRSRMGFPELGGRGGSTQYGDTVEAQFRANLKLNMENIYFSGSPCTTNHMNPVVRLKPLSPETIFRKRKMISASATSATADISSLAATSVKLTAKSEQIVVQQLPVVKKAAQFYLPVQNVPHRVSSREPRLPTCGDPVYPTESDFTSFILDKFEHDIMDESYDWTIFDVNWHRHFLNTGMRLPGRPPKEPVPEEEPVTLKIARELAINFFTMEEEKPAFTRDDHSICTKLTPVIEIDVEDEVLEIVDRRCVEANRKFGKYPYVVLNKFYHCKRCKNKCYYTPDLMNHIKYCRKYIHRDYNHTKPPAIKSGKLKEQVYSDPKLKMQPIVLLNKDYECPGCKKSFPVGSKLLAKHLKPGPGSHKNVACRRPETHDCDRCNITFTSLNSFLNHVNTLHKGIPQYKCNFCIHATFQTLARKQEHIAFYHLAVVPGYPIFKCSRCSKCFRSLSARKKHENSHKEVQYRCTRCTRIFNIAFHFRAHCLKEHNSVEARCCECPEVFQDLISYQVHYRVVHRSQEVVEFDTGRCEDSQNINNEHRKVCSIMKGNSTSKPRSHDKAKPEGIYEGIDYRCTKCKTIFQVEFLFRSHCFKEHETNEVGCSKCSLVFQDTMQYHLHYQAVHRTLEIRRCVLCEQEFSYPEYTEHVKSCTYRKTYVKPCPKSRSQPKPALHSDGIGYRCVKCGACYTNCFSFTTHAQNFHGSAEVQCVKCFDIFETLMEYHRHFYSAHKNEGRVHCFNCRCNFTSTDYYNHLKTCRELKSDPSPQPNLTATTETNISPGTSNSSPVPEPLKPNPPIPMPTHAQPTPMSTNITVRRKPGPACHRKPVNGMSSSPRTLYRPRGNGLRSKSPEIIVLD